MRRIAAISIGIATLPLVSGYARAGFWLGAGACAALGGLWLIGLSRGRAAITSLGLLGYIVMAAVGVGFALPAALLLVSVVAALAAWDLARADRRLRSAEQIAGADELAHAHLRRLLVVAGVGLGLGAIALVIQAPLSFGGALLLAALAILGLSRAIGHLNRAGDEPG